MKYYFIMTLLQIPQSLYQLAGLAGGLVSGVMGLMGANAQNQNAEQAANTQMAYETQMSDTAHQRDVADLKAAGLNPILSANAGSSTPSVGQAPVAQTSQIMQGAVNTGLDAQKLATDMRSANSTIALQTAQGIAANAAATRDAANAKKTGLDTDVLNSQKNAIKSSADVLSKQNEFSSKFMKFDQIGKRVQTGLQLGNSAKDLLNPTKGLIGAPEPAVPSGPQTTPLEINGNR